MVERNIYISLSSFNQEHDKNIRDKINKIYKIRSYESKMAVKISLLTDSNVGSRGVQNLI